MFVLLRCIGEAVLAQAPRALARLVPFGEDLWEIAADAVRRYRQCPESRDPRVVNQELAEVLQTPSPGFEQIARGIADELAAGQPEEVRRQLTTYLTLVPERVRQTFSRPEDRSGRSVPARWVLRQAADLIPLLPPRLPQFQAGQKPAGAEKWVLEQRLGIGGFGEVWKARHVQLANRFGAFKFCLDPEARERLLKHEAKIINQVMEQADHPGIVKLLDVDLHVGTPWLLFEYVGGGDLASLIERWPGDLAARARLATDAILHLARTVAHCHSLTPAVVHRDLKPGNVLVAAGRSGEPLLKITDFGIGDVVSRQALDEEARRDTQFAASRSTPSIVRAAHTPLYASRQQRDGEPAHPADDVHALGVLWYQLLLGDVSAPLTRDYRRELAELGLCDELVSALSDAVAERVPWRLPDGARLAERIAQLPADLVRGTTAARGPAVPVTPQAPSLDEQLEALIREAGERNARAKEQFARHDYAGTVATLEGIRLTRERDEGLYQLARQRVKRVAELKTGIRPRVADGPHDGLLELVEELLELEPDSSEMQKVAGRLRELEAARARREAARVPPPEQRKAGDVLTVRVPAREPAAPPGGLPRFLTLRWRASP